MQFRKMLIGSIGWIAVGVFMGCSGGGAGSDIGNGTLSIGLTDSSTDKYQAVYVTIDEVQVNKSDNSGNGNSGWTTVASPQKTYNLLSLINGATEVLGDADLQAGTYRQIRLIAGNQAESEHNFLGNPHPYANYVILNDGSDTAEELKIPSGIQTGIKLTHNFEVLENDTVELVLDFDACRSVIEAGNDKYLLKPTIKVIETESKSEVAGVVADADTTLPLSGVLVSAQISDGLSATVARSSLSSDAQNEEGQYTLFLSPEQTYNIVAYATEKIDDGGIEKLYAPDCKALTAPADEVSTLNFNLEKSDIGTINGEIYVNGTIDPDDPPVVDISFYTQLDCGYVEVITLPMSPDATTNTITFSTELPLGEYDVVAASEGLVPDGESGLDLLNAGDSLDINLAL